MYDSEELPEHLRPKWTKQQSGYSEPDDFLDEERPPPKKIVDNIWWLP